MPLEYSQQHFVADIGQLGTEDNRPERIALGKGTVADCDHLVADGDGREGAPVKGVWADVRVFLRNSDMAGSIRNEARGDRAPAAIVD
jgi:hypothetical protein